MEQTLRFTLQPTLTSFLMPPSISRMSSAFPSVRSRYAQPFSQQ